MSLIANVWPITWLNYIDPSVEKVSAFNGSPIPLFIFILGYLYLTFHLAPKWMERRKAFDLRPYMLINNALIFGACGTGIPLALWLSSWARIPWKCSEDRLDPMIQETQIYLGIAFFWLQILIAVTPIFMILRKKSTQNYKLESIRCCSHLAMTYFGLRMHPRGPFLFRPLCEITLAVCRRAYYIIMVPGSSSPYSGHFSRIKRLIQYLALFSALINTYHLLYFVYHDCTGVAIIKVSALVSSSIESVYLALYLTGLIGGSTHKVKRSD